MIEKDIVIRIFGFVRLVKEIPSIYFNKLIK